jgi:type IV secretion system protein VirB8
MAAKLKDFVDDRNWYKDRYQQVLVQRKILAAVTMLSLVCTLATVLVIARLTPLKTVEPFVIQVDQKSGVTQTVDPLSMTQLTTNEVVNNYFIVQYIRSRENYNALDIARNYNIVRVMSEPARVYGQFRAEADPNNPNSNAAKLGSAGTRTIKFRSIVPFSQPTPGVPQQVQVHVTIEERGDGVNAQLQYKIITLSFEYIKLQLTEEERYINPLGFRVVDYRVDQETVSK